MTPVIPEQPLKETGFIDDLKWNLKRHNHRYVAGTSSINLEREKVHYEINKSN